MQATSQITLKIDTGMARQERSHTLQSKIATNYLHEVDSASSVTNDNNKRNRHRSRLYSHDSFEDKTKPNYFSDPNDNIKNRKSALAMKRDTADLNYPNQFNSLIASPKSPSSLQRSTSFTGPQFGMLVQQVNEHNQQRQAMGMAVQQ